jgi:trehalose synthase
MAEPTASSAPDWDNRCTVQACRVGRRTLRPFRPIIRQELTDEIDRLARPLRGLRVTHVNATPTGGGVAEILQSLIPLLRDVGIEAEWYVMPPDEEFFAVTKRLHNLLQGAPGELSEADQRVYRTHNERTWESLQLLRPDIWVIHDPQPAAAGAALDHGVPKVWRSHIDTSQPNPAAAAFLRPYLEGYDAHVYSHARYRLPGVRQDRPVIIEPAIDPLTRKNRPISRRRAQAILSRIGLDPDRPLVAQVARLDPWKDPIGVIDAYHLAKQQVPSLQLALLGVMAAKDDPEADAIYQSVQAHAGDDSNIHVYVDGTVIGPDEVAAVQSAADVVLQKSLREGFGLSATEAMWKGQPLIVGDCDGLRLQVEDGVTGCRVDSVEACAAAIVDLLHDRRRARQLARTARERVRERFLLPRLLRDHLRLYTDLVQTAATPAAAEPYAVAAD